MSLDENIRAALLPVVQRYEPEAGAVVKWTDETENIGYCSTCSYEAAVVILTYRVKGSFRSIKYLGSFADLIRAFDGGDLSASDWRPAHQEVTQ